MGDSAYSFSLTTFSPSGKLVQIEYALNAVASGATSLGVKGAAQEPSSCAASAHSPHRSSARARWTSLAPSTRPSLSLSFTHLCPACTRLPAKNGVVIATEKKVPSILIDETSYQKILMVTENIALVYSGMGARHTRSSAALAATIARHPDR